MAAVPFGSHLVDAAAAAPKSSLVSPGLAGFLVVVAIGLVLWALLRSMSKHVARVRNSADEVSDEDGPGGSDATRTDGDDGAPDDAAVQDEAPVRSH